MSIRAGLIVFIRSAVLWGALQLSYTSAVYFFQASVDGDFFIIYVFLLYVAICLSLFWLAPFFVDLMAREQKGEEGNDIQVDFDALQSIAFSAMGLYFLFLFLTDMGSVLFGLFQLSQTPETLRFALDTPIREYVIHGVISGPLGIYLLMGARGLKGMIRKYRNLGLDPVDNGQ